MVSFVSEPEYKWSLKIECWGKILCLIEYAYEQDGAS